MKFKAVVIGNPGEAGDANYCRGVEKDLKFYPLFLRSALGGAWKESEIEVLFRPSVQEARSAIAQLKDAEYSVGIFCGHGYTKVGESAPTLVLKRAHEISSLEFRRGARKHTLILDCCRKVEAPLLKEDRLMKALAKKAELDPSECRKYYENWLSNCAPSIVVQFACATGESAGDSSEVGGYYSSSLLLAVRDLADSDETDTTKQASVISVVRAHEAATRRVVALSNDTQHPQIEKPRSDPYFPFGIIA